MRGAVAAWVVVLGLGLVPGCALFRSGPPPFTGEPFLLVWAGDADRRDTDFLAVIDTTPSSKTYGTVVATVPVGSGSNEPQAVNAVPHPAGRLFATGARANRVFVFDVREPRAARLLHVDEAGPGRRLWAPGEPVVLPNGHVAVACADPAGYRGHPRELLVAHGGLLELDAGGRPVREVRAEDRDGRGLILAPHGAAALPAADRLITTSTAHGYAVTTAYERMPGIAVQIWRLGNLAPERTILLPAGPRGEENLAPVVPRTLHRRPVVYVDTEGGGLYVSDTIHTEHPSFRLVHDFGPDAEAGDAAITPDDRFYVVALGGQDRLASFDLRDPRAPKPVSAVRLDRDPLDPGRARTGGPYWVAMSADGTRVAVSNYTVDVPGHLRDGDHRVYLVRLDPATGRLGIDGAFRDEETGAVGVSFDRLRWPHGETGPARPAGLAFVAPAPPEEER